MSAGGSVRRLLVRAPAYGAFYDLFRRAGANVGRVTELLEQMMRSWPEGSPGLRQEILNCEHEGDGITHELIRHLHVKAFAPFDARDAHELASELDDIVDFAEEVADFMGLCRVEAPTDHGITLARILRDAGHEVAAAMHSLDDLAGLRGHVTAIDRLEHEGDQAEREALSSLFDGGVDPMVVIRWKDIYERLEAGIDACSHVANQLEGLAVKRV